MAVDILAKYKINEKDLIALEKGLKKAGKEAGLTDKQVDHINASLRTTARTGKEAEQSFDGMGSSIDRAGQAFLAYFAIDRMIAFGNKVIDLSSEFQKLEAMMTTSIGSESEAQLAMGRMTRLGKDLNLQITGLNESLALLANRNLNPTDVQLRKMLDFSKSAGKDLKQLSEAIVDVNNTERWQEFGIKVHTTGDKIKGTFRGMTVEADRTEQGAMDMITQFGEMEGVIGTTEKMAEKLGGTTQNIRNEWDLLMISIGEGNAGPITDFLNHGASLLGMFNRSLSPTSFLVMEELVKKNDELAGAIAKVNDEEAIVKLMDDYRAKVVALTPKLEAAKEVMESLSGNRVTSFTYAINETQAVNFEAKLKAYERGIELLTKKLITMNGELDQDKVSEIIAQYNEKIEETKSSLDELIANQAELFNPSEEGNDPLRISMMQAALEAREKLSDRVEYYQRVVKALTDRLNGLHGKEKEQLGLLEKYSKELKELIALRKSSTSESEIQAYDRRIDKLTGEINRLKNLNKEYQSFLGLLRQIQEESQQLDFGPDFVNAEDFKKKRKDILDEIHNELVEFGEGEAEFWEDQDRAQLERDARALELEKRHAEERLRIRQELNYQSQLLIDHLFSHSILRYDDQVKALEDARNQELRITGDNREAQANVEERYEERLAGIEKKQRARKRQLATVQKLFDLLNIRNKTSAAAIAALAPPPVGFGPLLGGPVAANIRLLGALEAITVAARPIPAYAKGKFNFRGIGNETSDENLAWISDQESITPARATKQFGDVLKPMIENPHFTWKDLKSIVDLKVPSEMDGALFHNKVRQDNPPINPMDIWEPIVAAIEAKTETHISMDKEGFKTFLKDRSGSTEMLNDFLNDK